MLNFHMSIQALHIYIYSSFQKLPKKQRVTMKRNSINIHHVTSFSSSPFWCVFFLVLLCKTSTNALVKQPPNETTPAIIVFGDSIVDAGNNDDIMTTLARCNYPPYGIDFDGGIPTGRFCNGKVATDFIGKFHVAFSDVILIIFREFPQ